MQKFPQTFPDNGKVSRIVISPEQRAEIDKHMVRVNVAIMRNYAIAAQNAQYIRIDR